MTEADLARMRLDYETTGIDAADLDPDPLAQFGVWFDEAVTAELIEPNAMVISTVDGDGMPWSRYVLLKGVTEGGFDFYTNYESNKSTQLADHPQAAATFGWLGLHRQVNIAGTIERIASDESDAYWAVRTRGSQLGGWASAQSTELADRQELLDRYAEAERRFSSDRQIPRPNHWGGWRLRPTTIEFWQGRQNRLHDRIRYRRRDGGWSRHRLSP
jgi:pyridoxamine 5'-phosphate oxidase